MATGAATTIIDRQDREPRTPALVEARHLAIDPRIRQKVIGLRTAADMAHAAQATLHGTLDDVRVDLARKRRALDHDIATASPAHTFGVLGHGPDGIGVAPVTYGGPPDPTRQLELDRLAEHLRQLERLHHEAEGKWRVLVRVAQNTGRWVDEAAVALIVPVVVTCERLADPRAELATIRTQLARLDDEARGLDISPVGREEALARLDEQRKKVAARVAQRRAERVRDFFSPRGVTDVAALGRAADFGRHGREVEDAIREAAEDAFLSNFGEWQKAIKAHVIPGTPVSSSERVQRCSALAQEKRALMVRAETLVLAAERAGFDLDRPVEIADFPDVVACTVLAEDAAA